MALYLKFSLCSGDVGKVNISNQTYFFKLQLWNVMFIPSDTEEMGSYRPYNLYALNSIYSRETHQLITSRIWNCLYREPLFCLKTLITSQIPIGVAEWAHIRNCSVLQVQ